MTKHASITLLTKRYNEFVLITERVEEALRESGIQEGLVAVISQHTTTGIAVNESLECLESDLGLFLERLVPEDLPYSHARILPSYGSTAGNPTGHLKSHITGNSALFPVVGGKMLRGSAQDIYLCEFDGPAQRTINLVITGD
ncbi:MAG TPA: secondary thiamine-phosphate synthase enzyme YjbQ [Spirochaetia bacterium]|nr:secondary thiamine-phosphate synthase enzyme YjbQ [Spirochaetia bacterium]